MNKSIGFHLLLRILPLLVLVVFVLPNIQVSFDNGLKVSLGIPEAYANVSKNATLIFFDDFEDNLDGWGQVGGSFSVNASQSYNGTKSVALDQSGSIYKQFPPSVINSPDRYVSIRWYPTTTNLTLDSSIMSFEEGSFTATNKCIEMFWSGNQTYFKLYRYADNVITSTTTSANITVTSGAWHLLEFTSNTTATKIEVDGVAATFGGVGYSTVLTNVYDWVRLSTAAATPTIDAQVSSSADDCYTFTTHMEQADTLYLSDSSTYYHAYTRFLNIAIPKGTTINHAYIDYCAYNSDSFSSNLTLYCIAEDNTATFSTQTDADGRAVTTANKTWITGTWTNVVWYGYSNDPQDIKSLVQEVVNRAGWASGNALAVKIINNTKSTSKRQAYDYENGTTRAAKIHIECGTVVVPIYFDDIYVYKQEIVNTSDLFGRTYDAITATTPSGDDGIQAIYRYLLTRNATYLTAANTSAGLIQTDYNSGNKNLPYVKEVAILSQYIPSNLTLLASLTEQEWNYKVNHTTYLPYYTINSSGISTTNWTFVADPPDALSVVDDFIFAYKATSNTTYLNYAQSCLNAVNTYMKHPTYGTIVTSVNATNGAQGETGGYEYWDASRGGDEITNFIETALLLYGVSGNSTWLNAATYQANQFTTYAWDATVNAFHYRPDYTGYEVYVPSMSVALVHLYEATANATYLSYAESNFLNYMTYFRRNGLMIHYFLGTGQYGHEPGYLSNDVPFAASLLYKYTSDPTYLNISDNYTCVILDNYFTTTNQYFSIGSDNYSVGYGAGYAERQEYLTDFFCRFITPSSGVSISWAYGLNLYGHYRGLATAPMDVYFERNAVHLLNVSGSGNITFGTGINTAYITYGGNNYTFNLTSVHVVTLPPENISSSPTSYNFGVTGTSSTLSTGLSYFTVTNNSTFAVTITISGTDMTGGIAWTLSDDGNPGANIVGFKAGLSGGDYTIVVKKNSPYNTLVSGLGASGSQQWGLKMYAPTSFSDGVSKSGTITLTAVAS